MSPNDGGMNDLPSQGVNPHHIEQTRRRHRLWTGLAVLALGAVLVVGVANWLAEPLPGARPTAVAVSLPPSPKDDTAAANLPSLAPPAGSVAPLPDEPAPAGALDDGPQVQMAMLPPHHLDSKTPASEPPAWLRLQRRRRPISATSRASPL